MWHSELGRMRSALIPSAARATSASRRRFHPALEASAFGVVASVSAFLLAAGPRLWALSDPEIHRHDFGPRVSVMALFGVLTSTLLVLTVARGKLPGRLGAVASLATLGWLALVARMVPMARVPIIDASGIVDTTLPHGAVESVAMWLPLVLASAGLAIGARHRAADRVIRVGACLSFVWVGVAASVGASRLDRPDTDTYVESLPIVTMNWPPPSGYGANPVMQGYLRELSARTGPLRSAFDQEPGGASCPSLPSFRHDGTFHLWISERNRPRPMRFAVVGGGSQDITVRDSDLGNTIAPPLGWTVGALVGLAFQMGLLGHALHLARAARKRSGIEGALGADGWVAIAGKPPIHVPGMLGVAPGPVVLFLRPGAERSYRESGVAIVESWRAGTLDQANDDLVGRATSFYALAMTSGLLCAAPLLVRLAPEAVGLLSKL